jgi:hypothetical protein
MTRISWTIQGTGKGLDIYYNFPHMTEDFDATVPRAPFEAIKNAPSFGSIVTSPEGAGVIIDETEVGSRKMFKIVPLDKPDQEPVDVDVTAPIEKMDHKKVDRGTLQGHIDALQHRIKTREAEMALAQDATVMDAIHIDHLRTSKRVLEQLRDQV